MSIFPDPCGTAIADSVRQGADPVDVVPDDYVVVRGGASPINIHDTVSGAIGPNLAAAAAAVLHGKKRHTKVREVRASGGTITWVPEKSRHGTMNFQHVDISISTADIFSALIGNPVQKSERIDGNRKN